MWKYCVDSVAGTRLTPSSFKKSFRLMKEKDSYVTVNFSTPDDKKAPCLALFSQASVKMLPASKNTILPGLGKMLGNTLIPIHTMEDIELSTVQEILSEKDSWLPNVIDDLFDFNNKRSAKKMVESLVRALNGNQVVTDPAHQKDILLFAKVITFQG